MPNSSTKVSRRTLITAAVAASLVPAVSRAQNATPSASEGTQPEPSDWQFYGNEIDDTRTSTTSEIKSENVAD